MGDTFRNQQKRRGKSSLEIPQNNGTQLSMMGRILYRSIAVFEMVLQSRSSATFVIFLRAFLLEELA